MLGSRERERERDTKRESQKRLSGSNFGGYHKIQLLIYQMMYSKPMQFANSSQWHTALVSTITFAFVIFDLVGIRTAIRIFAKENSDLLLFPFFTSCRQCMLHCIRTNESFLTLVSLNKLISLHLFLSLSLPPKQISPLTFYCY